MIAAVLGLLTGGSSPRQWLPWLPWLLACILLLSTGWLVGKLWHERAETSRLAGELADALVREDVLRDAVLLQNARIAEEQAAAERAVADVVERARTALRLPARKPTGRTAKEVNQWLND